MATNFYILQKSVCHAIGFNFCDNEYLLLKIPLLEEKNLNKNDFYNGKKKGLLSIFRNVHTYVVEPILS